jgi:hypothetical protein
MGRNTLAGTRQNSSYMKPNTEEVLVGRKTTVRTLATGNQWSCIKLCIEKVLVWWNTLASTRQNFSYMKPNTEEVLVGRKTTFAGPGNSVLTKLCIEKVLVNYSQDLATVFALHWGDFCVPENYSQDLATVSLLEALLWGDLAHFFFFEAWR